MDRKCSFVFHTVCVLFYIYDLCIQIESTFLFTAIRYRYIENGKIKDKGKRKTDENGLISISLPDLKTIATRYIEVEFDDPQYTYKKTFYLPSFTKDFDVKFFPEGGALLTVAHQNIAFKAQGSDGGISESLLGIAGKSYHGCIM